MVKAIARATTYLKRLPLDSGELKAQGIPLSDVEVIREGQELELLKLVPFDTYGHSFLVTKDRLGDRQEWWAYDNHWLYEGTEPENNPQDEPAEVISNVFKLPGISLPVNAQTPIYYEGRPTNFTWGEFTKNGDRIPVDTTITSRLIRLAGHMDKVRSFLGGKPITITSGYRDPVTNRRVGGATFSQHLQGNAVDFQVAGMSSVEAFNRLKMFSQTGGLAVGNGFVHRDLRDGAARWMYPGGPKVSLW